MDGITWYKIKKETYELIYKQVSERYEDILSESESITNKSIKIAYSFPIILTFIYNYLLKDIQANFAMWLILMLSVLNFYLLFKLMFPKNVISRGLNLKTCIDEEILQSDNIDYQEQFVYYKIITSTQRKTEDMRAFNSLRHRLYKRMLLITFSIIMLSIFLAANLLSPALCS